MIVDNLAKQIEIKKHILFSKAFLWALSVQFLVLAEENWKDLPKFIEDDKVLPILGGLTHKDHIDALALRFIIENNYLLQSAVLKEGFAGGFSNNLKALVANFLTRKLLLSRHNLTLGQIKNIRAQRDKKSAVSFFLTGNRNLMSDLKGGVSFLMEQNDVFLPFTILSDTKPVFPSGSNFRQELPIFIKRTTLQKIKRTILRKEKSKEFLSLMPPISKEEIDLMGLGLRRGAKRKEIVQKLEVLRAYGVLKLVLETTNRGESPLFKNQENLPLFEKSQQILKLDKDRVGWMVENNYFSQKEVAEVLALRL